jgi:hypothetical protein
MLGEGDTVFGFVIETELHCDAPEAQRDAEWKVQTEAANHKNKIHKKNCITIDNAYLQNSSVVGLPLVPCAGHHCATYWVSLKGTKGK